MIYRWKHSSVKQHLWGILQGFAEIADGLVTLSTLALYGSGFGTWVAWKRAYCFFQEHKKLKEGNKPKEDTTNAI